MGRAVRSWEELRAAAPAIAKELNATPVLTVAALANPVIVLEQLGWAIEGDERESIIDRLRLGPEASERLAQLRVEIHERAGRDVKPQDPDDVRRLLDELKLSPATATPARAASLTAQGTMPVRIPPRTWTPDGPGADPLDAWVGAHPVLDLLREYRRLDAARPPFAPSTVVEAVRAGRAKPAVTAAHIRFQSRSRRRPETTSTTDTG